MAKKKVAIIAGAGPAGLTAALELLRTTNIQPVIYELSDDIGGISKTVTYKGNKIDIGGHRFFSKSDIIMDWWETILPVQQDAHLPDSLTLKYQGKEHIRSTTTARKYAKNTRDVMLVRSRLSRIYHDGKFFDYPLTMNAQTVKNLGMMRLFLIGVSYVKSRALPRRPEKTLEDFLINRFGKRLYLTFFKDYTEKVWGTNCRNISAEWGAQRIKGLSISKVLVHALRTSLPKPTSSQSDHRQKNTETSLIERFLYPKYGPGQLWEKVASDITSGSGKIYHGQTVVGWQNHKNKIKSVDVLDYSTGKITRHKADYFLSTVPIKELVWGLNGEKVPRKVEKIADGLAYRDFITVGLLIRRLNKKTILFDGKGLIADNWIYIQDKNVKVGRVQIFNNWSPHLVSNPENIWVGLEYFTNEGDDIWQMTDKELKTFAEKELQALNFVTKGDVIDGLVVRVKKAYPAYTGTYSQFGLLKNYLDRYENLFLIGRNGMHRYNNQDHSMLTAIQAVHNISNGTKTKANIWSVNTDHDYHESSKAK